MSGSRGAPWEARPRVGGYVRRNRGQPGERKGRDPERSRRAIHGTTQIVQARCIVPAKSGGDLEVASAALHLGERRRPGNSRIFARSTCMDQESRSRFSEVAWLGRVLVSSCARARSPFLSGRAPLLVAWCMINWASGSPKDFLSPGAGATPLQAVALCCGHRRREVVRARVGEARTEILPDHPNLPAAERRVEAAAEQRRGGATLTRDQGSGVTRGMAIGYAGPPWRRLRDGRRPWWPCLQSPECTPRHSLPDAQIGVMTQFLESAGMRNAAVRHSRVDR